MIQPAFASNALESLQEKALALRLDSHPYWLRLLHYRTNLLGRYQSEIDDASFFVSRGGRRDPRAELFATLGAFFAPSPSDTTLQHAICRYPARFQWLREQLGLDPAALAHPACERYQKWKDQMLPQEVALVFASSYMSNPSSMYGHTFLLLRKKAGKENELMNYVVNFAADLEGDSGLLFAVKGLLGGYHGRFSTFPYYMKVQEYSNLESRDLWEYDLRLSTPAIARLIDHLWELGNARLRYFFLNKNCSYYLMPLLEVADPSKDYKSSFLLKTIPADTLRVATSGQVGGTASVLRPSHAKRMLAARARLKEAEVMLAEQVYAEPDEVKTADFLALPPERQALVLESAHDLFRYKHGFSRDQSESLKEKEHLLLQARSQLPPTQPAGQEALGTVVPPDQGHKSGRIGLSYGVSNRSHFEELSLRPAIHDQEDPAEGYLPGSKLEMFHLKLRMDNDRSEFYVQQFSLIDMVSIVPYDRWIHPPSWKVNSGFAVAGDLDRDPEHSLSYGLNLGPGYTVRLFGSDKALLYGMVEMTLELGHMYENWVRFGGGPSGGLLLYPVKLWRMSLSSAYFPYAVGGTPATVKWSLVQSLTVAKDFELRVKLERLNSNKEALFSLVYYL